MAVSGRFAQSTFEFRQNMVFFAFFVVNRRPWASLSLQNGQSDLLKESSGMSFVNFGVILKKKSL